MNVTIKGKGAKYSLNKNDFVASGGEGSIYRKGAVAFKIYSDPKKMIPLAKMDELAVLTHPNIIRPQDVLLDEKDKAIGYTMRYLKDTFAFCQLFPKAFKDRYRIRPDLCLKLVRNLQDIIAHCHSAGILLVDVNELNFLVDDAFSEVYAIDCDSYKTKNFHGTALMDSVRDRHASGPGDKYMANENTDWFSFGVISFQLFIGIHPYRGKHPVLKSMDDRMLKNVSVLNDAVSTPAVCAPFTDIPQAYRDWYKAVFDMGKRLPPPDSLVAAVVVQKAVKIVGSNSFNIKKVQELEDDIVRYDAATRMVMTDSAIFNGSGKAVYKFPAGVRSSVLGLTPKGREILAYIEKGKVQLVCVVNPSISMDFGVDFSAESLMSYGGNIYAKNGDSLFEIEMIELGSRIVCSPHLVSPVLDNATKLFDGIVVQDLLGACYVVVCPASKTAYSLHVKELDGKKIIDAKHDGSVVMAVAYNFKDGKYDKILLRLNAAMDEYEVLRIDKDVGAVGINFVVLDSGVCVNLNEKEEIEVFRAKFKATDMRVFDDPAISGDMKLFKSGTQAMFAKGNQLFAFEVKK